MHLEARLNEPESWRETALKLPFALITFDKGHGLFEHFVGPQVRECNFWIKGVMLDWFKSDDISFGFCKWCFLFISEGCQRVPQGPVLGARGYRGRTQRSAGYWLKYYGTDGTVVHPCIHLSPFIWGQVAGTRAWAAKPRRPSPRPLHPALSGGSEVFPGQPRDIIPTAWPGSYQGPPTGGTSPEHLTREAS